MERQEEWCAKAASALTFAPNGAEVLILNLCWR